MCILLSLIFVTSGRVCFIQTTECNYRKYVMVESPFSSLEKAISSNRKFTVLRYIIIQWIRYIFRICYISFACVSLIASIDFRLCTR